MTDLSRAARAVLVGAPLALATAIALAQAPDSQGRGQAPTFRTGANFVRVDAVVTDRNGTPQTDLTKDDFEITEGGKRQQISTFSQVMLDGGLIPGLEGAPVGISSDAVEQEEAARDDVRLFTIFLDDYHVSREASRIVREQLSRFVETQLGPSDMVGVMYPLTSLASIRMTRDHAKVVALIQQFEGRRGDYTPKNAIEAGYVYKMGMGLAIEEIRKEVVFSALRGLAMHMGALKEARQTVILVTEGYVGSSRGGLNLQLRDVAQVASRYNTAIYPVSPEILAPNVQWMPGSAVDSLHILAQQSGGRAIVDQARTGAEYRERYATVDLPRSQLTTAMKQMVIDASVYYLLGYNSPTAPDDKFHRIDVKVKRRNVEVRHHEGYWARKAPQPGSRD